MRDELVKDRIVVGVSNSKLREYLIDVEDLNLQRCIQKAKQYVTHHEQALQLSETAGDNLDATFNRSSAKSYTAPSKGKEKSDKSGCPFCRFPSHPRQRCPARNSVCRDCKQKGHWAKSKACQGKRPGAETAEVTEPQEELEGLFLDSGSD